jgi:hypothetical protein
MHADLRKGTWMEFKDKQTTMGQVREASLAGKRMELCQDHRHGSGTVRSELCQFGREQE